MDNPASWLEPGQGDRDELFVVVHGFADSTERMRAVRETIRAQRPNADIFAPLLPVAINKLCAIKAEVIVADLLSAIDQFVLDRQRDGGGYQTINFVGHSFGAVVARRILIAAFGEQVDEHGDAPAPFEPELAQFRVPRAWAPSIRRIVLLAGMNRGWTTSSAMDWITTVIWNALQLIGEIVYGGRPTIFAIRRGAPFLVNTRLQWIALMEPAHGKKPDIVVVQLLGTRDDHVSPDDNVDYSVDFAGAGVQSYFYVEVRHSNHANVIEMASAGPAKTKDARDERRSKFLFAMQANRAELATQCVTRDQMADNLPPKSDDSVTDVVFVVHGIRDKGFWTQKIARNIKRHAGPEQKIESVTASYGYFAMLPFMLRAVRQRKVEWLMDCYTEARARFPRAHFHYFGHSNGTYLAAQALQDYPAARFQHVVFAGSVVRCDYDWLSLIRPPGGGAPRVGKVLNYVATRDWVVALFPKAVQRWKRFNLGSAGHDGFAQASPDGPVYEVNYIIGSHEAGHEEANWDDIARFIVRGEPPPMRYPPFDRTQNTILRVLGAASFILFPVVVALVLAVGVAVLWPFLTALGCAIASLLQTAGACTLELTALAATLRVVAFVVYCWIIYLFVTRF